MAGILLSGWRIRLFDSAGNPLYPGRVEFFDATTSLPKTIYADKDLTVALGTSVTTDLAGYLPAIWLSDGYYKGIVSQRIQADPETWKTLWTINHLGKELASTGAPGSGIMAYCENIAELKAIEAGTIDAAIVAGYYGSGDCGEPLFFKWDASSTKTDDAGAYIRSNDTPSGTAGRYHQTFPTGVLDIRRWGGIPNSSDIDCTGALVNMGNYACDYEIYPNGAPTIGFPAAGVYKFSGATSLNRVWRDASGENPERVCYYIGQNARIDCAANSLTFANQTTIESEYNIVEYPTGYTFEVGSVEYIRPQWLPNYHGNLAKKIETALANNNGITVKVYGKDATGEIDIEDDMVWEGAHLIIDAPSLVFSSSTGSVLTINNTFEITDNHYIFQMSTLIGSQTINAAWFGWGCLSGNNQASALQSAINASNGQVKIFVPRLTNASHTISTGVYGTQHIYPHTIIPEGTIPIEVNGALYDIYVDAPVNQYVFLCASETPYLALQNPTISPRWFGALEGSTWQSANLSALKKALYVGARGRNIVDGGGGTFYVSGTVSVDLTGASFASTALVSLKNITINGGSAYNVTNSPEMLKITGPIDCELESVNINVNKKACAAIRINTYWSRIRHCFFQNDVKFDDSCEDYAFTNNQVYGEISGSNFTSAAKGAVITGNTFTQCRVHLIGDGGIQTGYKFPMLQNMIVSNNIFQNLDGSYFRGCLYVISRAVNTLVNGLNITDNVFSGNIPAWSNNGEDVPEIYRYRISNVLWSPGTWAVSEQPTNDVRHLMVIRDNIYQWYDPTRDEPTPAYPYNRAGHRQNYLPATSGFDTTSRSMLTATSSNDIFAETWTFSPDPRSVFMLAGDTTTQFISSFHVRGWRPKTGEHTYGVFQPFFAHITCPVKPNADATASVYYNKKQFGYTAGSTGFVGSSLHYGWQWEIYESF